MFGGAVYHSGSTSTESTYQHCDFIGNVATEGGGAVAATANSKPTYDYCNFYNNTAPTGGAINTLATNGMTITHCAFKYNQATVQGSAINFEGPAVVLDNLFKENFSNKGTLSFSVSLSMASTFVGNAFTGNVATLGAALYVETDGNVV